MMLLKALYARYRSRWLAAKAVSVVGSLAVVPRAAFAGMTMLLIGSSAHAQSVDPAFCRNLVAATPSADVAYQPGVDVHGNAVAPADLPGSGANSPVQVPTKIQIPLTFNLAQTLHLNTAQYPASTLGAGTEGYIGMLTVDNGVTYFNGKPLDDAQQQNLAVLCMKKN